MPDSDYTRLLRRMGRYPDWYTPRPDHETDWIKSPAIQVRPVKQKDTQSISFRGFVAWYAFDAVVDRSWVFLWCSMHLLRSSALQLSWSDCAFLLRSVSCVNGVCLMVYSSCFDTLDSIVECEVTAYFEINFLGLLIFFGITVENGLIVARSGSWSWPMVLWPTQLSAFGSFVAWCRLRLRYGLYWDYYCSYPD
jgi:hypothetical protein